jgi:hypothetical protein
MPLLEGGLHSMHPFAEEASRNEMLLICQQVDRLNERSGLVKASPIHNYWRHSRPNAIMTEAWGMLMSLWVIEKEVLMRFRLDIAGLPEKEERDVLVFLDRLAEHSFACTFYSFPTFMQWLVMPLKP